MFFESGAPTQNSQPTNESKSGKYARGETKQTWILQFSYIVHRQHLVELPKREISKSETSIARNNKGCWFEASKFVELPSGNWWSSFYRNHCGSVLPSWLFGLGGWIHRSGHLLCSVRLSDLWPNLRCSRRKPIFYIRFFCPPYSSAQHRGFCLLPCHRRCGICGVQPVWTRFGCSKFIG